MCFSPGARAALALLATVPLELFVISNQSGVALGKFQFAALAAVEIRLRPMFSESGATLRGAYWCPHHPEGSVAPYARLYACRKPAPGMLLDASLEHALDPGKSRFVGDILDDVEAGTRAGSITFSQSS